MATDHTVETRLPKMRQYELERVADKNITTAVLLGVFLSPFAYVYVGRHPLAVLNVLTVNYLLFGFIAVPIHTAKIIAEARRELREGGVEGY